MLPGQYLDIRLRQFTPALTTRLERLDDDAEDIVGALELDEDCHDVLDVER